MPDDVVPAATVAQAKKLLNDNGVAVAQDRLEALDKTSVKKIVAGILQYMCFMAWTEPADSAAESSAERALDVLRGCKSSNTEANASSKQSESVSSVDRAQMLGKMWDFLSARNDAPLKELLNDFGVESAVDLGELEEADLSKIEQCLKPVQQKKFRRVLDGGDA